MSTTPKRPSPRRHVSTNARYRSSKMCNGSTACGKRTVPSGNIGSGLAITPSYRVCRSIRTRSEARRGRTGLLATLARQQAREHIELARGLRELPQPPQQPGEVATLTQGDARDAEPQARDPDDRVRVALQQRVLQVPEHPLHDGARTDRHQEVGPEPRAVVGGGEQLGTAGQVEPGAV